MTFSIVARDEETGDFGVAVASHWFNVGCTVPVIESGVGVMAIQACLGQAVGLKAREDLRSGKSAEEALALLLAGDAFRENRQVAIVDRRGEVAVHTGANCFDVSDHLAGEGFSVQANMMSNAQVIPAMMEDFLESSGSFIERLCSCLEAGDLVGGDMRGRQAVGLMVAPAEPGMPLRINLQVADHPEPLLELRRLVRMDKAYNLMNEGDLCWNLGDHNSALSLYQAAIDLTPENVEFRYWYGITLLNCGYPTEAATLLKEVYGQDVMWEAMTERLIRQKMLTQLGLDEVNHIIVGGSLQLQRADSRGTRCDRPG